MDDPALPPDHDPVADPRFPRIHAADPDDPDLVPPDDQLGPSLRPTGVT